MAGRPIAAIYARLSEEDRVKINGHESSRSIINQLMLLRQYAEQMGWDVYECYTDDDWAGADRNRPAFNRLLRDAEQGKFNMYYARPRAVLPGNWRWLKNISMDCFPSGAFALWGL